MHRFRMAALAFALWGCGSLDAGIESLPYAEQVPQNAGTVYRIVPSLIDYHYVDSRPETAESLRWLPSQGFVGYNCVAFTPRAPTDTVGTFVFVARDANRGLIERIRLTIADTLVGFFIATGQGSRGTYVIDSQNRVTLSWSNGVPARYFDPAAVIRIVGDSLVSAVSLTEQADSITASWSVTWTERACAP